MTHASKLLHHFWDEIRHSNGITALNTSQKMELKKKIKFCSGWQMMSLKRASLLHHVLANAKEVKLNPFRKNFFSKIFTFCKFFSLSRPQSKIIIHSQEILNFEILFVAFFLFAIVIKNGKPSDRCFIPGGMFRSQFLPIAEQS